jgi:peptide/nickel transport system substrate-binding protein
MLEEAGWDFDRELELMVTTGIPNWTLALQVIQQQLADIGVNSVIKVVSGAARAPTWTKGELDMEFWCGGEVSVDPALAAPYWATGGSEASDARFSSPRLDELFAMGAAPSDQNERKVIYDEAQEILNDELPFIWMYGPNFVYAVNSGLDGFESDISYTFITSSAADWNWP